MHLGSIYLIVNDFKKSVAFYEKLLDMPVTSQNMDRFAQFIFEGKNISIMNGHFDTENPDKIVRKGEYSELFDDLHHKALAPNTHKFVLNFWVEDLKEEHDRIKRLGITTHLSAIKYFYNVAPYCFFSLTDPDENIIEITGHYDPEERKEDMYD